MPQPNTDPSDLVRQLQELRLRIEKLEARTGFRRFATADRPPPSELPGSIIFNTTTMKHETSNGVQWTQL